MSLVINFDGTVVAVKPWWVKERSLHWFVERNREWIEKTLLKFGARSSELNKDLHIHNRRHYLKYKEDARRIITNRVEKLNKVIGLTYNRISIRNQKTRWGSCAENGNLSFNYKLIFRGDGLHNHS